MPDFQERILTLLFMLTVVLIVRFDYQAKKTVFTPFSVLAVPLAVIVGIINFSAIYLGFFPVRSSGILQIFFCVLAFRMPGFFIKEMSVPAILNGHITSRNIQPITLLFVGVLFACLLNLLISGSKFGWVLYSEEFGMYYSSGLLGHIMLFGCSLYYFIAAYMIKFKKFKLLFLLTPFFIFMLIILIKYYIFALILVPVFYYLISYQIPLSRVLRLATYVAVSGFGLFFLAYVTTFLFIGSYSLNTMEEINNFIVHHFFSYLLGPVISFSIEVSEAIRVYPSDEYLNIFMVPINLFRFITGAPEYLTNVSHYFIDVSDSFKENAGSIFSAGFRSFGFTGNIVFFFLNGTGAYLLYELARSDKSEILKLLFSYLITFVFLGFFGYYFNILSIYEISVYILISGLIIKFSPDGISSWLQLRTLIINSEFVRQIQVRFLK